MAAILCLFFTSQKSLIIGVIIVGDYGASNQMWAKGDMGYNSRKKRGVVRRGEQFGG